MTPPGAPQAAERRATVARVFADLMATGAKEFYDALDAELTAIETSGDYARLEREMAAQIHCDNGRTHSPVTMTFEGGRVALCSECAYERVLVDAQQRRPVGVAPGGQRS